MAMRAAGRDKGAAKAEADAISSLWWLSTFPAHFSVCISLGYVNDVADRIL